ncbi:hypothetical protein GCM10027027_04040 [Neomicrococcus lactis]
MARVFALFPLYNGMVRVYGLPTEQPVPPDVVVPVMVNALMSSGEKPDNVAFRAKEESTGPVRS